jgi:subtilisin family serine protease
VTRVYRSASCRPGSTQTFLGHPPQRSGTYVPTIVAVIDGGFALNTQTGIPENGNRDYDNALGPRPLQFAIPYQPTAGGSNPNDCGDYGACPWHGQEAFGVCCAQSSNLFGTAGTGDNVVTPMLIRMAFGWDWWNWARAIWGATENGASVISMSSSGDCFDLCTLVAPWTSYDDLEAAVNTASGWGAVPVAAAGNHDPGEHDPDMLPCKLAHVICVGAINPYAESAAGDWVDADPDTVAPESYSNWGDHVDIWAPDQVYTTPIPGTPANARFDQLPAFTGTSAATPFVSGIAGLMKARTSPDKAESRRNRVLGPHTVRLCRPLAAGSRCRGGGRPGGAAGGGYPSLASELVPPLPAPGRSCAAGAFTGRRRP